MLLLCVMLRILSGHEHHSVSVPTVLQRGGGILVAKHCCRTPAAWLLQRPCGWCSSWSRCVINRNTTELWDHYRTMVFSLYRSLVGRYINYSLLIEKSYMCPFYTFFSAVVFSKLTKVHLPDLHDHLNKLQLLHMISLSWFLTLFIRWDTCFIMIDHCMNSTNIA